MLPHKAIPRFSYGPLSISALNMKTAIDIFFDHIAEKRGGYIAVTCTHGVIEVQRDPKLRKIIERAVLALPDGMPLVWLGRMKGLNVDRVTGSDFLDQVMSEPRSREIRHYFYGATPETLEKIVRRAKKQVGANAIVGWHSPPFRAAGAMEDPDVIAEIASTKPDIIWVGLGLPKQEYWMANHQSLLPSTLMVGVGAAFDFFAGTQSRAPLTLQKLGLEWLHRLLNNPLRMWPRYSHVVPKALSIMLKELVAIRSSKPTSTSP